MSQKLAFADDHFHDECGVFGVFGHPEAANLAYLGLTPCNIAARNLPASSQATAKSCTCTARWAKLKKFSSPACWRNSREASLLATRATPPLATKRSSTRSPS